MRYVAMVFVVASCSHYHHNVDSVLAQHKSPRHEVAAPTSLLPVPAKVGQWVLYRESRNGETVGYQLAAITNDTCGPTIEYTWGRSDRRTVSKACYSALPDLSVDSASWTKLVDTVISQSDDNLPIVIDLHPGMNLRARGRLDVEKFHLNFDGARWRHDDMPRDDIAVPAGEFAKAIRTVNRARTVHTWFHPAVPITSMVKSHTEDGLDVELVAYASEPSAEQVPLGYDDAGATEVLAEVPGPGKYIECIEDIPVGTHLPKMECRRHDRTTEQEVESMQFFEKRGSHGKRTNGMGGGKGPKI